MRHQRLVEKMQRDWDERARCNPRHYIADGREDWSEEEFFQSGEVTISQYILNDMVNICQDRDPARMRVLELGCGAGRVTRALARVFGAVHAVDLSPEMVALAKRAVADLPNVTVHRNNGRDLSVLGDLSFDFAFSCCVFHHISSKAVIEGYIREVGRHLRPGCLFKFEVQGHFGVRPADGDTWLGAPMSEAEMLRIAKRCGFDARYHAGVCQERFWHWFFRQARPPTL